VDVFSRLDFPERSTIGFEGPVPMNVMARSAARIEDRFFIVVLMGIISFLL
jgi:hypothetical protein